MKKLAILLALAPLCAGLSGCISFGAKPPPSLLTLDSVEKLPVGTTQSSTGSATITVGVPVVPQELAVARVPVRSTDTAIAYVKDAQWVEAPNRLFARLMADTIAARTGRVVLSWRQSTLDPGARLSGELRNFGVEAATSQVVVTYDATLQRGEAGAFEKRRFEARVPVAAVTATAVGLALNQAANQVAGEVADWVGK